MIGAFVRRQVAGENGRQRMRMNDAPSSARSMRQTEDRVALARAEVVTVGPADDVPIGRVDGEQLIGLDQLLVDTGGREEQPAVFGRPADATTRPGHPATRVEITQQPHEEATGCLFVGGRDVQRHHARV